VAGERFIWGDRYLFIRDHLPYPNANGPLSRAAFVRSFVRSFVRHPSLESPNLANKTVRKDRSDDGALSRHRVSDSECVTRYASGAIIERWRVDVQSAMHRE